MPCSRTSSSRSAHFVLQDPFIPQASCIMLGMPRNKHILQFLSGTTQASDHIHPTARQEQAGGDVTLLFNLVKGSSFSRTNGLWLNLNMKTGPVLLRLPRGRFLWLSSEVGVAHRTKVWRESKASRQIVTSSR